jgi:hypothetical protein
VLHKGGQEAAIAIKPVPCVGTELVLTVGGEWLNTRLFRHHEQAELASAIADTRAMLESKGWA